MAHPGHRHRGVEAAGERDTDPVADRERGHHLGHGPHAIERRTSHWTWSDPVDSRSSGRSGSTTDRNRPPKGYLTCSPSVNPRRDVQSPALRTLHLVRVGAQSSASSSRGQRARGLTPRVSPSSASKDTHAHEPPGRGSPRGRLCRRLRWPRSVWPPAAPTRPPPLRSADASGSPAAAGLACPSGKLTAEGSTAQANAMSEVIAGLRRRLRQQVHHRVQPDRLRRGHQVSSTAAWSTSPAPTPRSRPRRSTAWSRPTRPRALRQGNPAWNLPMVVGPIAFAYNLDGVDKLVLTPEVLVRDLHRQDHHLERPGDRQAQLRRHPAEQQDLCLLPLRRVRHHREHQQVPQGRQQRRLDRRAQQVVGGHRRGQEQVLRRRRGRSKATPGSISYMEWSYAKDNNLPIAADRQRRGPVELTAATVGKALSEAEVKGTGNDLALSLKYTDTGAGAYPALLVTYEIVCSKGLAAEQDGHAHRLPRLLRLDRRPRARWRSSATPRSRPICRPRSPRPSRPSSNQRRASRRGRAAGRRPMSLTEENGLSTEVGPIRDADGGGLAGGGPWAGRTPHRCPGQDARRRRRRGRRRRTGPTAAVAAGSSWRRSAAPATGLRRLGRGVRHPDRRSGGIRRHLLDRRRRAQPGGQPGQLLHVAGVDGRRRQPSPSASPVCSGPPCLSSALAMVIAVPIAIGVALCITQYVPQRLSKRAGLRGRPARRRALRSSSVSGASPCSPRCSCRCRTG